HGDQGDLVVRGSLRQGIHERGTIHIHYRRPRRPLGFQALVALHAARDVVDGFALLPDQFYTVEAAIALVEEGHIVNVAIAQRYPNSLRPPPANPKTGKNLSPRRCHRRHAHQPTEHGGYEPTPPQVLQAHRCVPLPSWFSSQSRL